MRVRSQHNQDIAEAVGLILGEEKGHDQLSEAYCCCLLVVAEKGEKGETPYSNKGTAVLGNGRRQLTVVLSAGKAVFCTDSKRTGRFVCFYVCAKCTIYAASLPPRKLRGEGW